MAFMLGVLPVIRVCAATISDAKQQKKETEQKLSDVQEDIEGLEEGIEEAEAEIEEIDHQLVDLLATVEILKGDIAAKEEAIAQAENEYEAAIAREEAQHEAMNLRIKFMYEKGDATYVQLFLQSKGMAELLNKVEYVEKLYDYDRKLLIEYQQTKQDVFDAKTTLEEEKAEIEEVEKDLEEQSEQLAMLMEEKKRSVENFDAKLSAAKKKAKEYQAEIKKQADVIKQLEAVEAARKKAAAEAKRKAEQEAKLKKLQEEKKRKAEADASDGGGEEAIAVEDSSEKTKEEPKTEGSASGGSGKGREIADYACQFVGNPYVAGGTSLTEGCDCSGFTGSVYAHFGISLPRSSYAQATAGREVGASDMQPGDVIYYGGHVGLYIGNGMIVHASTAATGIKYSSAYYRTIITIRRFV